MSGSQVAHPLFRAVGLGNRYPGNRASISTIAWPPGIDPANLKGFETQARDLRFQTLGHACRTHRVWSLLFGHHAHDVHENLLMRLVTIGTGASGLTGTRESDPIAACDGGYAISRSGEFDPAPTAGLDPVLGPEAGGVYVHRPLLAFPKERLIATCRAAGLPWVEDETNANVELTQRNAVRKIVASGQLPRALQLPAMTVTSETCRRNNDVIIDLSLELFRACRIELFDMHAGTLTVQVPAPDLVFGRDFASAWSQRAQMMVLSSFVRFLAEMVAPRTSLVRKSFEHIIESMFSMGHSGPRKAPRSCSTADTMFLLCDYQSERLRGFRRWVVHRSPYSSAQHRAIDMMIPRNYTEQRHQENWEFKLWDGRFWIRVHNRSNRGLVMKPTTAAALKSFAHSKKSKEGGKLLSLVLRQVAPYTIKETIPTLQLGGDRENPDETRIVALPTLGIARADYVRWVNWQVHYKMVDPLLMEGLERVKFMPWKARPGGSWVSKGDAGLFAYRRESSLAAQKTPKQLGFDEPALQLAANPRFKDWKAVDIALEVQRLKHRRFVGATGGDETFRKVLSSVREGDDAHNRVARGAAVGRSYRGHLVGKDEGKSSQSSHVRETEQRNYHRYRKVKDAASRVDQQRG